MAHGWKRNALPFAALFFVHYAAKMCDRATDYRVSRRLVNHPARSDKSIGSDDRAEENGGLGHTHTHTDTPSVPLFHPFVPRGMKEPWQGTHGRNIYLCTCVGKRWRREKPAATSIDEIDSRWDKLFIPRDKFSDKTVGSRMLLTSNGIFMSPGEIERRTTSPPSGPIVQSAERKTRARKLRAW